MTQWKHFTGEESRFYNLKRAVSQRNHKLNLSQTTDTDQQPPVTTPVTPPVQPPVDPPVTPPSDNTGNTGDNTSNSTGSTASRASGNTAQ